MKLLAIVSILFVSANLIGQDTKKKTYENELPPYKEIFYVLKSDPEIKHGDYKKIYGGFSVKGQFNNNKKIGIWEYYNREGQLEQKIDFTDNKIVYPKAPKTFDQKYWINDGETLKEVIPDEQPFFLGGAYSFYYYIASIMRYPADARRHGVQGKVHVSAVVSKEGKLIDEKIEEGIGHGCDEEALRVIQLVPDEWMPGKVNDENVDLRIEFKIIFKLD